jgi:hypothetical protein
MEEDKPMIPPFSPRLFGRRFVAFLSLGLLWPFAAQAAYIDLATFTAEPGSAVSISPGGSSATIYEAGSLSPVTLKNENVVIPSNAGVLRFDYELVVASNNKDYFDFYIQDESAPAFEMGGKGAFGTFGTYRVDLAGLAGGTVPIIFHLMSDWDDMGDDSYVTISDLQILPIPLPGTLVLLGSGILSLLGLNNTRKTRRSG